MAFTVVIFAKLAIPRRVYTQSHVDYIVEVFEELLKNKDNARGIKILKNLQFLRHFTFHFDQILKEFINNFFQAFYSFFIDKDYKKIICIRFT